MVFIQGTETSGKDTTTPITKHGVSIIHPPLNTYFNDIHVLFKYSDVHGIFINIIWN